jgi:hypothetical protein
VKQIPLSQGKVCLVDDEDFEHLKQWKWHYNNRGYAARLQLINGKYEIFYLHREIVRPHPWELVDHISGDKLDCQKVNLRLCTNQQNLWGQKKRRDSRSLYKGVSIGKGGKWRASIQVGGVQTYIHGFSTERHEAMAYDIWAKDLYGKYARLNF